MKKSFQKYNYAYFILYEREKSKIKVLLNFKNCIDSFEKKIR